MNMTRGHELDRETSEFHWLPFVSRAVILRSAIVAITIGILLALINQPAWVAGNDPLQLVPFVLVFVTPFVVVAISQIVAERQAFIDTATLPMRAIPKGFFATTMSHGIPVRAVAIGITVGSINAIITVAGSLLHSGDLAAVSIGPFGQAYALPLLFGVLSQTFAYRRAENVFRHMESIKLTF